MNMDYLQSGGRNILGEKCVDTITPMLEYLLLHCCRNVTNSVFVMKK